MINYNYVKDFNNYIISTNGDVYSLKYKKWLKRQRCGRYNSYQLRKNGKTLNKYIHHLVYDTFVGKDRTNLEIDHIDNNIFNNNLENLRLVSKNENCKNMFIRGSVGIYGKKNKTRPNKYYLRFNIDGERKIVMIDEDIEKLKVYQKWLTLVINYKRQHTLLRENRKALTTNH